MRKYSLPVIACVSMLTLPAFAADTQQTGQNAFTRAAKGPLTGIAAPVANPKTVQCNGVVDCRKKGGDLATVWQMDHGTDNAASTYPQRCYTLAGNGKYVYSAMKCR